MIHNFHYWDFRYHVWYVWMLLFWLMDTANCLLLLRSHTANCVLCVFICAHLCIVGQRQVIHDYNGMLCFIFIWAIMLLMYNCSCQYCTLFDDDNAASVLHILIHVELARNSYMCKGVQLAYGFCGYAFIVEYETRRS